MNAGRELDQLISHTVLGNPQSPMVRNYSTSIADAWEVATTMGITLIPIEAGAWFAMVGPTGGWKSPAEFLECLQRGDFVRSGAAVSNSAPLSICLAAINAVGNRNDLDN